MSSGEKLDLLAEEIQKAMLAEARKLYSAKVVELYQHPQNRGVVDRPNGFGVVTGICGDTMKIYLQIERDTVKEAKFEAEGCVVTVACGSELTEMVKGKTLKEVFMVSPGALVQKLGGLPDSHLHCAILAVNTLHSAVANYLFMKQDYSPGE